MFIPRYDLEAGGLRVQVVPKGLASEIAARATIQSDHQVDVGVFAAVDSLDSDLIDPYIVLLQEFQSMFLGRGLTVGDVPAVCIRAAVNPLFSTEQLREKRLFTGVLTLTFRLNEVN